jgi:hypothetical protein
MTIVTIDVIVVNDWEEGCILSFVKSCCVIVAEMQPIDTVPYEVVVEY